MFFFGKKKKDVNNESKKEEKEVLNKDEILKLVEEYENKLKDCTDTNEKIKILNKLGSLYFDISETDKAIKYYEESLEEKLEMGKAYTDLMKLYNIKRKEATENKDDESMKLYMSKIDELMKISKDMIRGRI